jgi:hypothetical protein
MTIPFRLLHKKQTKMYKIQTPPGYSCTVSNGSNKFIIFETRIAHCLHVPRLNYHASFVLCSKSFGLVVLEEKIFLTFLPIRNKNCSWWPSFSTDPYEMMNLFGGSYIHCLYKVTNHLDLQFQRIKCFKFKPIITKRGQWKCFILPDQDKIRNLRSLVLIGLAVSEEII